MGGGDLQHEHARGGQLQHGLLARDGLRVQQPAVDAVEAEGRHLGREGHFALAVGRVGPDGEDGRGDYVVNASDADGGEVRPDNIPVVLIATQG